MTDPWILIGIFIFLAYTVEAVTGFGSIVIALSLGALLLPIAELLPVLVPLNIAFSSTLSWRYRHHIHLPTLLGLVLPLMAVGTLAGYLLRPHLGGGLQHALFGLLIVWFSLRELWRMWRGNGTPPHGPLATRATVLAAGVTHGLFASGGPLLVYALAGTRLDKTAMRSTLIAVWLCLNSLLTVMFLVDGSLRPALLRIGYFLPVVLAGLVVGEWLHHRLDEQRFRQLLFMLLGMTGVLLALHR